MVYTGVYVSRGFTRAGIEQLVDNLLAGPLAFESYSGNIDLFQGYTTSVAVSNVVIYGQTGP